MRQELETIVNELKRYVKEYTENVEHIDKEHKGVRDYMKAYYQGKLDAYTHSLIHVDILLQRLIKEEEQMLQHMANQYDNEKEKHCIAEIYTPFCDCEMCGRK